MTGPLVGKAMAINPGYNLLSLVVVNIITKLVLSLLIGYGSVA